MVFDNVLDEAIEILQRRQRVTYRTLKRHFGLDDQALDDLKNELINGQCLATDQDGSVLVWIGSADLSTPGKRTNTTPSTSATHSDLATRTPQYVAEQVLTSRTAIEGERKQVTILFSDIKGSTKLISDLDPEDAQRLIDPAIHIMMNAVHRFGGTVNQVLGDGIMALFGAPITHEDHAVRACYAATAMQAAMRRYTRETLLRHKVDIQIRVGLNSGEVVVRTIGNDLHMDYSAVGRTTNLASRLEQLAAPGSIVISQPTLDLVEGLVSVRALGSVPVKGIDDSVDIYELAEARPGRGRFEATLTRGLTSFVGRDAETAVLHQTLEHAEHGHGQVIAVQGEPGVGKSRLAHELVHSGRTQGWLVLECASASHRRAMPYSPVIDLLRRYFHVEDDDDQLAIRAKISSHEQMTDQGLRGALPSLLSLLDALPENSPFNQLERSQRRQLTLDTIIRLLLRESRIQPLLLIFEDLHYIDSETQALLDGLVESVPTYRVVLMVNYRPEYRHNWDSKTYYTLLQLRSLGRADSEAFLEALVGKDPDLQDLKQILSERTEGNPLFLEEGVRRLADMKVLTGRAGAYRLARELPPMPVPPSVHAVLAARIDALPDEEKRLLQVAAVIGMEVSFFLLREVSELSEDALTVGLTHLQAREFLYRSSDPSMRVYKFKHALTQEVAYSSLLLARRRALHRQIVEALETLHLDQLTDTTAGLAHHAFGGEMWHKAAHYYQNAGAASVARSGNREAVGFYERALAAVEHLPESRETIERSVDLRLELKHPLELVGDLQRLARHLQTADAEATALDDHRRLGRIYAYMSDYMCFTGAPAEALRYAERTAVIAAELNDISLRMLANYHLGQAHHALANYADAVDVFDASLELVAHGMPDQHDPAGPDSIVMVLTLLAWCHAERGNFAAAFRNGETAVRTAKSSNRPSRVAAALFGLGIVHLRQGSAQQATSALEEGLEVIQSWDLAVWLGPTASSLGLAYLLSGRITDALPLLEQAVERDAATGIMVWHALVVASLGEGYLRAGRLGEATRAATRALDLSHTHKERGHCAWVLRLLGEIAMHRSDVSQSESYYRQSLSLADELGMRPLAAHCHHGLGTLFGRSGDPEGARLELSTAVDMYRDMDSPLWQSSAEAALSTATSC